MSDTSSAPSVEIFVDGANFLLARRSGGHFFRLDLNLLATRLSRGYHFGKLRYYTSPHPDVTSAAYRGQQKFFEELRRSRRIELVLGRHVMRTDRYGHTYHVEKETDVNGLRACHPGRAGTGQARGVVLPSRAGAHRPPRGPGRRAVRAG
jgi:hypothetical protein